MTSICTQQKLIFNKLKISCLRVKNIRALKGTEDKDNQTTNNNGNDIPNSWTIKEYSQSSFIRFNCLRMATIHVSSMPNKEMREISTLRSHKNLTMNTDTVVNSCHPRGEVLHTCVL